MENFSIKNLTRKGTPRGVPFVEIKDKVLGKSYTLSLVFCGSARSRKLNRIYRSKDKAANVLSFPLTKDAGEIFVDLSHLKQFSVAELFIHGLFHLKGMEHGVRMESAEKKVRKNFGF